MKNLKAFGKVFLSYLPLILIFAIVAPLVFGDPTASPLPVIPPVVVPDPPVPFLDWLKNALTLGASWGKVALWTFIAAAVKLLVDATKTDLLGNLFHKLGDTGQILLINLLSVLSVGTTALASGVAPLDALMAAVGSAGGAMLLHEAWTAIATALGLIKPSTAT